MGTSLFKHVLVLLIVLGQLRAADAQAASPRSLTQDALTPSRTQFQGAAPLPTEARFERIEARLNFTHLAAKDGLSNGTVTAMLQDRHGFLWIGTAAGLNRFDGYQFTRYTHNPYDSASISANHVFDLYEDTAGALWIATYGGGVDRFDPQTGTFIHYRHHADDALSLRANIVFTIMQDAAGRIWFGGPPDTGLNRYDAKTDTIIRGAKKSQSSAGLLANAGIWQIHEDAAGLLWLVADFAITRFNPQTGERRDYGAPPGERHLNALAIDQGGTWWAGGSLGLYAFDPQHGAFTLYQPDHPVHVDALTEYPEGTLWVGTDQDGLHCFDLAARQFTGHYLPDPVDSNSLSHRDVNSLFVDAAGLLWIGTRDGVNVWDWRRRQFQHYHIPDRQSNAAKIPTLHGDRAGHAWGGTDNALFDFDLAGQEVISYPLPPDTGSRPTMVTAIYAADDGGVWVGVSDRFYRFDPQTRDFTLQPVPDKTTRQGPPVTIFSIYEDEFHALWLAVEMEGLFRFDPKTGTVTAYRPPEHAKPPQGPDASRTIASIEVRAVTGDRQGHLWLGYRNGIFSQMDLQTGQFTHYFSNLSQADSLHAGWIETVHAGRGGMVWIGSRQGLSRFDPQRKTFRLYAEQEGLTASVVSGIAEDGAGRLWLSTPAGLSRFDPVTEEFRQYDAADGVGGAPFNPRAAYHAPDGRILFGGENGILAFYPDDVREYSYPSPVVLTNLYINHQAVEAGHASILSRPLWETERLRVTHDAHAVAFEFAALNVAAPQKIRYRYRLEGFDPDWHDVDSTRRFVMYTDLHAGTYRFQAQASTPAGRWNERATAAVTLTVLPPWWATAGFRALMAAGAVALAFAGYRWRTRTIRSRNKRLEALVRERTTELSAQAQELTRSYAELRLAKNAADDAQRSAEAANQAKSRFLAHMSHELRTPLNAILGFTQILARAPRSSEDQNTLKILQRNGEHLLKLINQVLDFSKIEAGHIPLNENIVDLDELLRDMENLFRLRAGQSGLRLLIQRDPAMPRFIRTDDLKLRQILMNLLSNAIKFTPRGEVHLNAKAAMEEPGMAQAPSCRLDFSVADTGPGLAADELGLIFEPFGQTATGRQFGEGTGLGLPISRKFAQLLGGDIRVASRIGAGTRFTLEIRAQIAELTASERRRAVRRVLGLQPGQPRCRILIADDAADNRKLLLALLQPLGFDVYEAKDGHEAVKLWMSQRPDIIFMDMRMPVLDGSSAARDIRRIEQGQSTQSPGVPIIALTAGSLPEDGDSIPAIGCDDYIRKPFHDYEIFDMLRAHLGVRFVYDGDPPAHTQIEPDTGFKSLTPEALAPLPAEWKAQLKQGAEEAKISLLKAVTDQIRTQDASLADALRVLIDDFEYDEILRCLGAV